MTEADRFGALRSLLHGPPTPESWRRVCDLFADESAFSPRELDYALAALERWPDELRRAPISWLIDAASGSPRAGLRLVRSVVVTDRDLHPLLGDPDGTELADTIVHCSAFEEISRIELALDMGRGGAARLAEGSFRRLSALHLPNAGLMARDVEALAAARWSQLEVLDLRGNPIGDDGMIAVAGSPYLHALRALDLSMCASGPGAARALATSPNLDRLEELVLSDNDPGDIGAEALASSPYLGSLRALDLSEGSVGDAGARSLLSSPAFGRLTSLDLSRNALSAAALTAFDASRLPELEELYLGGLSLGPEAPAFLSRRGALEGLTHLDLSGNGLDASALLLLANAEGVSSLRYLDLRDNPIGDEGAWALAHSPHLRRLERLRLAGTQISRSGMLTLRESPLLECTIEG